MSGGRYRDTYRFNLGGGLDTVIEPSGVVAGYNDKLISGAGIAPTDITVVRSGNHLLFKHANGVDQVTVANWFASSNYWLETVEFADGTAWTSSALTAAALVFSGTAGNDVLTGTVMNDTLLGLAGNDTISAWAGTNIMDGGDGDDTITGTADYYNWSANTLLGGAGNDTLSVEVNYTSANVFDGGTGTDSISGSRYNDSYRFNLGGGFDTISEPGNPAAGYNDKLIFGAGIAPTDITVVGIAWLR